MYRKKLSPDFLKQLRTDVYILYRSLFDKDVSLLLKLLIMLVIAYVLSPVDLVPDFIPVIGLVDEIILIPFFIRLIVKRVPESVRQKYTRGGGSIIDNRLKILGLVLVILIWISLCFVTYLVWLKLSV